MRAMLVSLIPLCVFLAVAANMFHGPVPKPFLLLGLGFVVLVVFAQLFAAGQKKRDVETARSIAHDTQRLHKPNENIVVDVLKYFQWGLVGVVAVGVASNLLLHDPDSVTKSLKMLVFAPFALGFGYLGRAMKRGTGPWLATRLRLVELTHRSVEFVILVAGHPAVDNLQAQGAYARYTVYGKNRQSEVLWRSPPTSFVAQRFLDRTEYRARIVMPADFQQELVPDTGNWSKRWHLQIKVSPSQALNFDFRVPPAT